MQIPTDREAQQFAERVITEKGPKWFVQVVSNALMQGEPSPALRKEDQWHEETCAVMGLWATPEARVHVKLASGTEVVVPLDVGEQFELLENVTVSIRGEKKRPESGH